MTALEELRGRGDPSAAPRDGARQPYWDKRVAHDGIFFMSFDDFMTRFSHIEHVDPPFGGVVQAESTALEAANRERPSAQWRIRPNQRGITRWDVSNLRFFAADGTELMPVAAIESASAADAQYDNNPGWDAKGMLFGGDGFTREEGCWGGRCPEDDELGPWVGGVFASAVAVARTTFKQDDFTEVVLEKLLSDPPSTWMMAQLLVGLQLEAAY